MLRAAQPLDANRAGAILSEFAERTPWMPRLHSQAEDIAFLDDMITRGWVTVAGREAAVESFMACDGHNIQALYVAENARGHRLGSALLAHAQETAKELTLWTFEANERAQAFYEARGFRAVERTDGAGNDEKLPDIRYEWKGRPV